MKNETVTVELYLKASHGVRESLGSYSSLEDARSAASEYASSGQQGFIDDHGVMEFVLSMDADSEITHSVEVATGETWEM